MGSYATQTNSEYDIALSRGLGLGVMFREQVETTPQALAVVDSDVSITYADLHERACGIAQELTARELKYEEPVGIVVQHGYADVVTQLAVIYAGGTCVPIDPSLAESQYQRRLMRLKVRHVVTDQRCRDWPSEYHILRIDQCNAKGKDDDAPAAVIDAKDMFPLQTGLNQRTHVIHTSGTTKEPKAVQIRAGSILHAVFHAPDRPVHPTDVVAHLNKSSFDVSLFDIWAPLLRGAQVAVLNRTTLLDPHAMMAEIQRLGITVVAITTALVNMIAYTNPRCLSALRLCLMGGEAANIAALCRVYDVGGAPEVLANAYGPTECCIYSLVREITSWDIQTSSVSIGFPIGRTIVYIADVDGCPADEGELWIGGPGVTTGYVEHEDGGESHFGAVEDIADDQGNPVRFYHTGDLVRRRPDGQIQFVGRKDHQVKIRGFRVELGAVETALMDSGLLRDAIAIRVESPQAGSGSILAAFAVPLGDTAVDVAPEVIALVRDMLPDYMVPQLHLVSHMPMNRHFKIDRDQLATIYRQKLTQIPTKLDSNCNVQEIVRGLFEATLALPYPMPASDTDPDFFALGATSLQAALLVNQIRKRFNIGISILDLYENSSLEAFTSLVEAYQRGRVTALRDEREDWIADSRICDDLPTPKGPVVDWLHPDEGYVFLTGATGFVGAFLLAELLEMPAVVQVVCLVRATDAVAGHARISAALEKYGLWQAAHTHKILAIPGALELDFFGMDPSRYKEVASRSSVVFHLGARVNYTQPYSLHRPVNTLGTANVVRFACEQRTKAIHYVSSISCFGPTSFALGTKIVLEDEPLLTHVAAMQYDHGYSQSQWVADQLLRLLIDRGFPIAIYRPGFITGHSQTGACNRDDFFSRLADACCDMGCYPMLPGQTKEFVPVDYVCAAMLHISRSPTSLRRCYHLVPSGRVGSASMDGSMELLGRAAQTEIKAVQYAEWVKVLETMSPPRLASLQPILTETIHQGRTRWELYEDMPEYDATNTREALADYPGGLTCPPLDLALMRKYLKYMKLQQ